MAHRSESRRSFFTRVMTAVAAAWVGASTGCGGPPTAKYGGPPTPPPQPPPEPAPTTTMVEPSPQPAPPPEPAPAPVDPNPPGPVVKYGGPV
jgi:hypothetical protein